MTVYSFAQRNAEDVAVRGRLAMSSFVAPGTAEAATVASKNRAGIIPTANRLSGLVTVAAATMTVKVAPFRAHVPGSATSQGDYVVVNTAEEVVVMPDGLVADKTYVVGVRIEENAFDASGQSRTRITFWDPTSLPSGTLFPLRNIVVPANKTSGNGGLVSGNAGTDLRTFTAAAGGVVQIVNQAERDAWTGAPLGQFIHRLDTDKVERLTSTGWVILSDPSPTLLQGGTLPISMGSGWTLTQAKAKVFGNGTAWLRLVVRYGASQVMGPNDGGGAGGWPGGSALICALPASITPAGLDENGREIFGSGLAGAACSATIIGNGQVYMHGYGAQGTFYQADSNFTFDGIYAL